jgi:hypothetical protein
MPKAETQKSGEHLLSITQLTNISGESESCWRKRLARRELPFLRLGVNVRVRKSDLDSWFAERTITPSTHTDE